jgi:hypothetical protein
MELRDVQSRLTAARLYAGGIDGDVGPLTRDAVQAFLLQHDVRNFDPWPGARRVLAEQQLICCLDGFGIERLRLKSPTLGGHPLGARRDALSLTPSAIYEHQFWDHPQRVL